MRVTVLGAGNGGLAVAFDFAQHGHDVALYGTPDHDHGVPEVGAEGGIHAEGDLEGFAPIRYAGHDAEPALEGADLVVPVGPAFATEHFAEEIREQLRPGMAVLVCPGSCAGALAFKRAAGLAPDDDEILVGETSTLPYASRATGPAHVRVFLKLRAGLYVAAAPRTGTARLIELISDVYAAEPAASVLQTTLQNGNPVIHPAVTLLNAGLVERGGDFMFYEDGVTDGVGRLIEAVDGERLAIAAALGVEILSEPEIGIAQGYMTEHSYGAGYRTAPGFRGIRAQDRLDHRYLTEDVGYSLVFLTSLARVLDVPTPQMDAVITIASTVLGRDFRGEAARTVDRLGLGGMTAQELAAL